METPQFVKERPIATTVFAVGAGLVLLWAITSRAAPSDAPAEQVGFTNNLPDANATLAAATQIQLAQIEATNSARALEYQAGVQLAELSVTRTLGELELQATDRGSERTYNLGQQSIASQERQFNVATELERYQIAADTAVTLQREDLEAQTAALFANNQLQAALDANATSRTISAQANSTARRQSSNSLIGSVVSGVLRLF